MKGRVHILGTHLELFLRSSGGVSWGWGWRGKKKISPAERETYADLQSPFSDF